MYLIMHMFVKNYNLYNRFKFERLQMLKIYLKKYMVER